MAEIITLAVPEVIPAKQTTDYRIEEFTVNRAIPVWRVVFRGTNGETKVWTAPDAPTALANIRALNTANLTIKSLDRRLYEGALNAGVFGVSGGAIAGAPD